MKQRPIKISKIQDSQMNFDQAISTLTNSIKTPVKPKFTFIDLFAGIGGFHAAAQSLGGQCVFASEIDFYARIAYTENYGITPAGDITKVKSEDIPNHDILFAGFPCQPFSIIGNRLGFNDIRGTLFFEIARILKDKKPQMFILENVKQLSTHNGGKTINTILNELQKLNYNVYWKVLNALDYGLPQKRERTIFVGFRKKVKDFNFPKKTDRKELKDILEDSAKIDKKHFASPSIVQKRKAAHKSSHELAVWHENKSGNISSHPYSCALRAGASYNYLLVNGERRFTPREQLRLQGFPDSFKIVCNAGQTRKQAGNAVPVTMIKEILKQILRCKTDQS